MKHDFYPAALKDSGVLSLPGRAGGRVGGRADKPRQHSHVHHFSRIIFKLGKDIYYPKISNEFDHGGSASLNMCIMDHLMSRPLLSFLNAFLAATKQLYDWFSPSVCPSVTPFSPCSHHPIIMKFSGVITMVRSDVHAKGQGQRSKVKVTEVNNQLSCFRTLTPVWIHIWQWNHAHSWKQHRRGAPLFFKVIRQISALKIVEFYLDWAFPDCNSSLNAQMATKWCTKLEVV